MDGALYPFTRNAPLSWGHIAHVGILQPHRFLPWLLLRPATGTAITSEHVNPPADPLTLPTATATSPAPPVFEEDVATDAGLVGTLPTSLPDSPPVTMMCVSALPMPVITSASTPVNITSRIERTKPSSSLPTRSKSTMRSVDGSKIRLVPKKLIRPTMSRIAIPHNKIKPVVHPKTKANDDGDDEVDIPQPVSLKIKRERQAIREEQVKLWKVREEREARDVRLMERRRIVSGLQRAVPPAAPNDTRKTKVKFNLKRNRVFEISEAVPS